MTVTAGSGERPASIIHAYAEVNGVRLHYASAGKGPLILFLHGFPEFWYAWKNQLADIGRDHCAVAPDMRGYNLSSKPAAVEDYVLPVLIEDVRAFAQHLSPEAPCDPRREDHGIEARAVELYSAGSRGVSGGVVATRRNHGRTELLSCRANRTDGKSECVEAAGSAAKVSSCQGSNPR